VAATTAGGVVRHDRTSLDGRFHIRGLPRGEWVSLEARAPGLGTRGAKTQEVPLVGDGQVGPLRVGPTGDLAVAVRDETGQPIAGATVTARRPLAGNLNSGPIPVEPWPEAARATSSEDGSAILEDLPSGPWALFASARGFARGRESMEHEAGEGEGALVVTLRPGHEVRGRVHLPGGRPAAGAVVAVLESGTRWSESISCMTTVADEEGRFRLEGLGRGKWPILVRTRAGVLEPAGRVEAPATSLQDLWLAPRSTLEGVVTDASDGNRPVPGARLRWVVSVRGPDSDHRTARVEARTDASGRYRVDDLPAGALLFLEAGAAGFLPYPDALSPKDSVIPDLLPGRSLRRDVALHRGAAVSGVARDLYGAPVRDAWVQVRPAAENPYCREVPTAWTDGAGRFVVPSAHPGKAALLSRGPGVHALPCSVTIPEQGSVEQDLVLVPDARVRGRVLRADGSPAEGFEPRVVGPADPTGREPTVATGPRTGKGGDFDLGLDRPGTGLRIVADGPGGAEAVSPPFDIDEGESLDGIEARVPPGGRVAGTVRRWDGGPLRSTALRLVPVGNREMDGFPWSLEASRAPMIPVAIDGSFSVEGVSAGRYAFSCTAEGCSEARGPSLRIDDGEERIGIEVVVPRGWEVGGVVRSSSGEPAGGAEVFLSPAGAFLHPGVRRAVATTDSRGRFRVEGLSEGKHELRVSLVGHPDAFLEAGAGDADLEVVLDPGHTVAGRIVDAATGGPIGGKAVSAWSEERPPGARSWAELLSGRRETVSAADGTFSVNGLREGPTTLLFGDDGPFRGGVHPVKILRGVPAGTGDLVVRLERGRCIAGRIVDPEGRPIRSRGLEVTLHAPRTAGVWTSKSMGLDRDGTFVFDCLPRGLYCLTVASRSFGGNRDATWLPARIDDVAAGTEDLVVALRRGRPVAGRLEPVPEVRTDQGAWLHIGHSGSRSGPEGNGISAVHGDGTFVTGALEEGRRYDLWVRDRDRLWVTRRVEPGGAGVVLRAEPMEGTISGSVVDEAGRAVPAGVKVTAESGEGPLASVEVETTAGGAFVLEGLGDRPYRLRAGGPGGEYAWLGTWPTLSPGAKGVVLRVRRGEVLRGTLRAKDGSAADGALVLVVDGDGEPLEHRVVVGNDGSFDVGGLPPGRLLVRFDLSSTRPRDDPEIARVTLPCAPLDLRVPDAEGE
jgi:hypothetical protein